VDSAESARGIRHEGNLLPHVVCFRDYAARYREPCRTSFVGHRCASGGYRARHTVVSHSENKEQFRAVSVWANEHGGVSALARYIHPEFGGFCLTTRFRRDIRVIAVSVLLGTTVGAVGAAIVGLNTRSSPASAGVATAISEVGMRAAEGSSSRVDDVAQNGTPKAGSASGGGRASGLAAEASPGPKATCPGATSGKEQGCSFFQPRRVRVRALTDAPDMARIAVGRPTAPSVAIENSAQNSAAKLLVSKPTEEISASVAPPTDQALSGRPVAKKLQKTTVRRARRNDRWMDPAPRDRPDPWFARAENNAGAARRPYAREASSARRGFWDWSW
jgi:hypothetical protein